MSRDIAVFKIVDDAWHLLLLKRKNEPFKNRWAFPGGFVDESEDLDAARRELLEEDQYQNHRSHAVALLANPNAPRQHTVSVAFFAFADKDTVVKAAAAAAQADWFP